MIPWGRPSIQTMDGFLRNVFYNPARLVPNICVALYRKGNLSEKSEVCHKIGVSPNQTKIENQTLISKSFQTRSVKNVAFLSL